MTPMGAKGRARQRRLARQERKQGRRVARRDRRRGPSADTRARAAVRLEAEASRTVADVVDPMDDDASGRRATPAKRALVPIALGAAVIAAVVLLGGG